MNVWHWKDIIIIIIIIIRKQNKNKNLKNKIETDCHRTTVKLNTFKYHMTCQTRLLLNNHFQRSFTGGEDIKQQHQTSQLNKSNKIRQKQDNNKERVTLSIWNICKRFQLRCRQDIVTWDNLITMITIC